MKRILIALAFVFAFARPAAATVAATGVHCKNSANAASTSCTASVTSGNVVVLAAPDWSGGLVGDMDAGGCSDNQSNVYHFAELIDSAGAGSIKLCIGYITTTASTIFTWTPPGGSGFIGINVSEYSGVYTTSILSTDQQRGKRVTGSNQAISTYATTVADEVIIAYGEWHGSGTLTCDSGYTEIDESESDAIVAYSGCYKILSATGAQTHTWVNGNLNGVVVAITLAGSEPGFTGTDAVFTGHRCDQSSEGTRVSSRTCALPVKNGNTVVVVGVTAENDIGSTNCNGITDSASHSFTYIITSDNITTGEGTKACYTTATADAILKVTFAPQTGGTGFTSTMAFEVAGFTGTVDQTASNATSGANATTGTTSATSNAHDLVFTILSISSVAATCGGGFTEWATASNLYTACYKNVTTTGTQAMTYTNANAGWAAAIAALTGTSTPAGGAFSALTIALGE